MTTTREYLERIDRRTTALEGQYSGLRGDVAELKTDVAELKTDVAELKTDVAELKTDVALLKTDMREVKVELHQQRLAHEAQADDIRRILDVVLDTRERLAEIPGIKATVTQHEHRISALESYAKR